MHRIFFDKIVNRNVMSSFLNYRLDSVCLRVTENSWKSFILISNARPLKIFKEF